MTSVVFFGSGPLAANALETLLNNFKVEAVVTKPQPEHHKEEFPVLKLARQKNIKCLTAQNKQELSKLFKPRPIKNSQLGIVIDYGVIITKDVIDSFPLGIINSHFSLLPQWRGADPITFSILSGQHKTGVSLMLINEKLDEGLLLKQTCLPITSDLTTPQLTDKLIDLSNQMLIDIVPTYIAGRINPYPQDLTKPITYSRKLTKADGLINWAKSAEQIEREIRAYVGWPGSNSQIAGQDVIIIKAHIVNNNGQPGKASSINKQLVVYCGKRALAIDRLKPAGKREMSSESFLAGYKLS